jgi:hypothetical protein
LAVKVAFFRYSSVIVWSYLRISGSKVVEIAGTSREYKGIEVTATFTQEFIDNYMYEDSKNYNFALKVDGKYYNVYRNEN